jgi:SAM-dependent methyltransferase
MAELVGSSGSIAAFDLAPDNIAHVQRLVARWSHRCSVAAQVASLLALPYPSGAFDAVWCANSLEYLSDEALPTTLAEFRRVVRPGGLIAIKDPDPGLCLFSPGDPTLLLRTWAAISHVSAPLHGTLRARTMRRRLERLGLADVWQRATLSEIWAPLQPVQRRYIGRWLMQIGVLAEQVGMAEADLAFWRRQRDPDSADSLAAHPDLFWCEGSFVTVGRVPDTGMETAGSTATP